MTTLEWFKYHWVPKSYKQMLIEPYDPDAPIPYRLEIKWWLIECKRLLFAPFWYVIGPLWYSRYLEDLNGEGKWWVSYDDRYDIDPESCPHCGFGISDVLYMDKWFKCEDSGTSFNGEFTAHWWRGIQTCPRCRHKFEAEDQDC